ncbi:hypothetical protein Q4595_06805 [Wenyingzhuangia sp. 1_MG-2023]|nr:hypothetical protein [Wenyingzhuangia sp. 1_MG-2023]
MIGTSLNYTLPIAFSGLCNFDEFGTKLLINCLPYKDKTIISVFYTKVDSLKIETFFSKYNMESEVDVLRLVEILAVRGTDNIFFNIDYWNNLDIEISKRILSDFIDVKNCYLLNNIDYSFL